MLNLQLLNANVVVNNRFLLIRLSFGELQSLFLLIQARFSPHFSSDKFHFCRLNPVLGCQGTILLLGKVHFCWNKRTAFVLLQTAIYQLNVFQSPFIGQHPPLLTESIPFLLISLPQPPFLIGQTRDKPQFLVIKVRPPGQHFWRGWTAGRGVSI